MGKPKSKTSNGSPSSTPTPAPSTSAIASNDVDTQKVAPENTASTKSKDDAIKARIIKHMNTEHADSLSLYLRHYSHLSPAASSSPRLIDLSYSSLTIASDNDSTTTYEIPIAPPMTSWSDVRPRVIAMDHDARAGLGLPPPPPPTPASPASPSRTSPASSARPQIHTYTPPTSPFHLFVVLLVLWFYSTYFLLRARALGPGHWYWEHVMCFFPVRGAEGYRWLNVALGWPVAAVHAVEAAWMGWRLWGLGVRPFALAAGRGLWWAWVASTLLEGAGAHQRLSALVRQEGGGSGSGSGTGEGERRRRRRNS